MSVRALTAGRSKTVEAASVRRRMVAALIPAVMVSAGLGVSLVVAGPADAAGPAGMWGSPTEIAGSPGGSGELLGLSCSDAGDCTAVGSDGNSQPSYVIETAGVWGSPTEIAGTPGGAGSFYGVSCVDAGDCTAVGYDGSYQPFYVIETAGVWGSPTEIAGTLGGAGYLYGVSCVDAGDCTAVGYDGNNQPFYVTETAGVWGSPTEIAGSPDGLGFLWAVNCVDAGDCTAVGYFGNSQPFYVTETAGVWGSPTEIAGSPGGGFLRGVNCTDAADCTAVGYAGNSQPFYVTETAGVWGSPTEIAGSPDGSGSLFAVSCVDADDCTAVGGSPGDGQPLYVTETGGVWGQPAEMAGSPDGGGYLYGVSCSSAVDCTAAGHDGNAEPVQPLYVTETASPSPVALSITNCSDSGAGSLRQAVADATTGATISFALSPSCPLITETSGPITIATDLTIDGPGAGVLAVSGDNANTVFYIGVGVTATISGLTTEDGSANMSVPNAGLSGGGILNQGTLTVTDSTVDNNSAQYGGGIANLCEPSSVNCPNATLAVTNSTVSNNTSTGHSGGILNGARATITDSTVSNNSTVGLGGGIGDFGTLTVTDSTLSGNQVSNGPGGGIFGADDAAGASPLTLTHATLSDNSAATGGGIYSSGATSLVATIVANSSNAGGDCAGPVTDGGYNLDDDGSCGFSTASHSFSDTPADLDPAGLKDNGGPTPTIALQSTSRAVDAVPDAADCAGTDQRGVQWTSPCDIGAVLATVSPPPPTLFATPTAGSTSTQTSYTGQLTTTGGTGAVTYTQTTGTPQVTIASSGAISSEAPVAAGTYSASGTDTDTVGDTGTWTFTLTVSAVTLSQTVPKHGSTSTTDSSGFTAHLATNNSAPVTYTVTAPATGINVSSSGAVSASGTLPAGIYTISGTDGDTYGDTGVWTYTVTVNAVRLLQTVPERGDSSTLNSAGFTTQLAITSNNGAVTFTVTNPESGITVSPSGAVSAAGALTAGRYSVSGTDSDVYGDSGTWTYSLEVNPVKLIQTVPERGVTTAAKSSTFAAQLTTTHNSGPVTFTVTDPAADVDVSSSGSITTTGMLAVGAYPLSGTDSDAYGDTGTWTYTLEVNPVKVIQTAPERGVTNTAESSTFAAQLTTTHNNGPVTFTVTNPAADINVSSSGAISTTGMLAAGAYHVSGSDSDAYGDTGTWTYTLDVNAVNATQAPMRGVSWRSFGDILQTRAVE